VIRDHGCIIVERKERKKKSLLEATLERHQSKLRDFEFQKVYPLEDISLKL
jgi:hypothetical protein